MKRTRNNSSRQTDAQEEDCPSLMVLLFSTTPRSKCALCWSFGCTGASVIPVRKARSRQYSRTLDENVRSKHNNARDDGALGAQLADHPGLCHGDGLLLHGLEERLVLGGAHLVKLVQAAE